MSALVVSTGSSTISVMYLHLLVEHLLLHYLLHILHDSQNNDGNTMLIAIKFIAMAKIVWDQLNQGFRLHWSLCTLQLVYLVSIFVFALSWCFLFIIGVKYCKYCLFESAGGCWYFLDHHPFISISPSSSNTRLSIYLIGFCPYVPSRVCSKAWKQCMRNCISKEFQLNVVEITQNKYQALILEKKGLLLWFTVVEKHDVKAG